MISFRVVKHSTRPTEIVEVLCDDKVCAVIYPGAGHAIKIVSAHFASIVHNDGRHTTPPIPELVAVFDPQPYEIIEGQIIRKPR